MEYDAGYAKINLILDVTGKRDDGYHEVVTLMHTISICDGVAVVPAEPGIRISVAGASEGVPTDESNLAYRAAKLFYQAIREKPAIHIRIWKSIPVGAGLGGGSVDAATVLRVLNRQHGRPLSDKRLMTLAAKVGSDVPFLLIGGTAICRGRGEKVEVPLHAPELNVVVAMAKETSGTAEAYRRLDKVYHDFDGSVPTRGVKVLNDYLEKYWILKTYNVFEKAMLPVLPGAKALKKRLKELGATTAMLTGSGAAVFGLFDDLDTAQIAASTIAAEGNYAYAAISVPDYETLNRWQVNRKRSF